MAKTKTQAVQVPVPQNREEAERMLSDMGAAQRELTMIETAMAEEIAMVTEQYEKQAEPYKQAVADKEKGLSTWAEANRDALTDDRKKQSVQLSTGWLKWHKSTKVNLSKLEVVLANLRAAKLDRFIRPTYEVNKEAILADPKAVIGVKGIKVKPLESFTCEPTTAELAEVGS